MNTNALIIAIISAIKAIFDIIEHAGTTLSSDEIMQIKLNVMDEIDRITSRQQLDEVAENKIVRG